MGRALDPGGLYEADALGRQAELFRETGRLGEARDLHERAVAIWRQRLGIDDPTYAAGLVNQANLLRELGAHAEAKELYEEALRCYERVYGPNHPHTATARTNLAGFVQNLGDFDAALPMLEQALAGYEAALGPDHEWVATGLNNLALLHWARGDPATAWPLLQRATAIWENTLGPAHPNTFKGRQNLAMILADVGEHQLAYDVQWHDLQVARERLGANHPLVGEATIHLAANLAAAGNVDEASDAYGDALRILEEALGPGHPRVADVRGALAGMHWDLGDVRAAREQIGLAFGIVETSVQPLLTVTSERERIALIRAARSKLDLLLTTHDRPADAARVHAAVLRWKGAVKASLAAERSAQDGSEDPALAAQVRELARVRAALATALFAPAAEARAPDALQALSARKEELERALAKASASFAAQQARQAPDPRRLCESLAPDEAVVDFLRFGRRPAKDDPGLVVTPHYTALVLLGGACGAPIRVGLGEAEPTDRLIARYRRRVASGGGLERLEERADAIRSRVWDPVAAVLGGRTRLWLVPDGGLTGLPFGALVREGRFLVEDLQLGYLASATDLDAPAGGGVGALVLGGITYDGGPAAHGPTSGAGVTSRGAPWGTLDAFGFLPATVGEASAVAATLARLGPVTQLSGDAATEGALRKQAPGSRFVHLATHGFFATGEVRSALSGDDVGAERAVGFNPMLLSGVVLAGANQRRGGGEDGVLTAEEVLSLDLRGVELVTLSACETGLGEVTDGEGVLGLRRAFALAGARALALSLWKVPDAETGQLMAAFYEGLATGAEPVAALRAAQLAQIEAMRAEGRAPHPLFWAAFLVSGR